MTEFNNKSMKNLFIILFVLLFIFSCDSDSNPMSPTLCNESIEVELWGECYNIDETTVLYINNSQLTGEIPPAVCSLVESNNNLYIHYITNGNYNLTNTCP